MAASVQAEQRLLLGYLVEQETASRIVEAAATVPLAEFESPDFHDHLQRSLRQSVHRPWELTQALSQLVSAVFGSAVVCIVLLTIEPWLLPALLLAGLPAAWATTRNSQALFDAWQAITPLSRERQYLQEVLTGTPGRQGGARLRVGSATCAAATTSATERARSPRDWSPAAHPTHDLGGLASTIVVLAALVALLALTVSGDVDFADAAIGAVAVQQLAVRVRGANSPSAPSRKRPCSSRTTPTSWRARGP